LIGLLITFPKIRQRLDETVFTEYQFQYFSWYSEQTFLSQIKRKSFKESNFLRISIEIPPGILKKADPKS